MFVFFFQAEDGIRDGIRAALRGKVWRDARPDRAAMVLGAFSRSHDQPGPPARRLSTALRAPGGKHWRPGWKGAAWRSCGASRTTRRRALAGHNAPGKVDSGSRDLDAGDSPHLPPHS